MAIDSYRGEYAFLSNFYYSPLSVRIEYLPGMFHRLAFPTLEHAFQAHKLQHFKDVLIIQNIPDPGDAKRAARRMPRVADWYNRRLKVMGKLIELKFWLDSDVFTHYNGYIPELTQNLLNTGNQVLIEGNTWGDTFWGVCDGNGENNLGKLQMQRRSGLREIIKRFTARNERNHNK
jgi:predicted NAD-dependent protein-ADP-ribosyltransferase YbiA (DUF1768 family)